MSQEARVVRYHGDALDVIPTLADESVDAVVTDPPYELGFMGRAWDASGIAYNVELWRQCLRVLKPGGHLLAFGGTRTSHRLAVAVEDAGFEIRDSIVWIYGSGFPKSLDVSKAIDKAAGHSRSSDYQANYGNAVFGHGMGGGRTTMVEPPVTDDAKRWAGWGTALKPAHEPIVVARKPLIAPAVNVLSNIESELRRRGASGEIEWTIEPANAVARRGQRRSSSSTGAPLAAGTSAAPVGASVTPSVAKPSVSDSATTMPRGDSLISNVSANTADAKLANSDGRSSMPTAAPALAATSVSEISSPSITSTEGEPPTARRPGARSTSRSSGRDFRPGTESFAGIATGLIGSWATVRIDRLADGTYIWPEGLPRSVAGGPLTVAANVLAHGTGALNIDACRVDGQPGESWNAGPGGGGFAIDSYERGLGRVAPTTGRWPANVVLDEDAAAELDEQSGTLKSGALKPYRERHVNASAYQLDRAKTYESDASEGGASRFFPVFRYQAKAPTRERVKVDGVAHPTVKPLELMRWLVRLVTQPDGVVLEPFAGSGTTVEACVLEGMRCLAIEREESYLPLIAERMTRAGLVAW